MLPEVKLTEVTEGKVRLLVPDLAFYSRGGAPEPAWAPIFYNPAAAVSRDLSVAILAAYVEALGRSVTVCEPLSATGVRGLRYAAEVEGVAKVVLNDRSELAYRVEVVNAESNGLAERVGVYNREARALLLEFAERGEKFDVVDIDPFGSPAPFVESALLALRHGGLLMVTATDLAPLFGSSPSSCRRKYFATPLRSEFSKEVGARILAAFVAREAAKLGMAATPIYTFLARHSLRVAFIVRRSRSGARRVVELIGWAVYCPRCAYRALAEYTSCGASCPRCGARLQVGGPAWTGELWERSFSLRVLEHYRRRAYLRREGLRVAEQISLEAGKPPLYTTTAVLASLARLPEEPSLAEVGRAAERLGVEFSRTHFDPKGFRIGVQPYELAERLTRS